MQIFMMLNMKKPRVRKQEEEEHMEYREFITVLKKKLQERLGNAYRVAETEVKKNNEVREKALLISGKSSSVGLNVYTQDLFAYYRRDDDLAKLIENVLQTIKEKELDVQSEDQLDKLLKDWNAAKEYLRPALISQKKNPDLRERYLYREYLDLAIIYIVLLPEGKMGSGIVKIGEKICELWGITEEVLYQTAMENLENERYQIQGMSELLADIDPGLRLPEDQEGVPMYVLSNESKYYGAAGILKKGILKELAGRLKRDLYLLPSSIHEFIIIPASENIKTAELTAMVQEINQTQVSPIDILEEHIYCYSRDDDVIYIAE